VSRVSRYGLGVLLLALLAAPLAAQESKMMKDSAMKSGMMKDSMMKDSMSHGMMMDQMMMAPHGMFTGAHDHAVSGGYTIAEQNGRRMLVLGDDFSLDGAPDPYVVLSGSEMGSGAGTLNLGRLTRVKGASSYEIPAGTDLATYSSVLIWCKKYDVTLGRADLAAGGAMMHK